MDLAAHIQVDLLTTFHIAHYDLAKDLEVTDPGIAAIHREFIPIRLIEIHLRGICNNIQGFLSCLAQRSHLSSSQPFTGQGQGICTKVAQPQIVADTDQCIRICILRHASAEVGHHSALKAPLIPQDIGQQTIVFRAVGQTNAVEGRHDRLGTAFLNSHFKGLQVDFTDSLLVCIGDQTSQCITVGFLIVECKVLHKGD